MNQLGSSGEVSRLIGGCRCALRLNLEELFMIVQVCPPCEREGFLSSVRDAYSGGVFRGVVLLDQEAFFFGEVAELRTDWDEAWLQRLIRLAEAAGGVFDAEQAVARAFLRRIFARGIESLLALEASLQRIKKYGTKAEQGFQSYENYSEAAEWRTLLLVLEDIEPRIRNLQMALGRLAVYLHDRWLLKRKLEEKGEKEDS